MSPPRRDRLHEIQASPALSRSLGSAGNSIRMVTLAGLSWPERQEPLDEGYADKPGKQEAMTQLHPGEVITSMADLVLSLRAHPVVE